MRQLALLPDEEIDLSLKPHPVAFIDLYVTWLLLAGLGLSFLAWADGPAGALVDSPVFRVLLRNRSPRQATLLLEALAFTIVGCVVFAGVAFVRTNILWVLAPVASGLGMIGLTAASDPGRIEVLLLPVMVALAAISQIEFYRHAHSFHVTNRRIVFERRYALAPHVLTDAYYPHITNLTVRYTMLERLVGAGTVIPVMSSGMNLGSEVVTVAGHLILFSFGASREKRVPRALPFLCFYAVREPEQVSSRIAAYVTGAASPE